MEQTKDIYPQKYESGVAKAQFLLKEITRILNKEHPGFTEIATQETQQGTGRDMNRFSLVTEIITKAIQTKIMQFKNVTETGWNSIYYDDISTAIPTYTVLNSIIEKIEDNQTIKDIIKEAKEKYDPEVLVIAGDFTPVGSEGGRKMRKSRYRHRKSNKKHKKGNKKHKRSIKKYRK